MYTPHARCRACGYGPKLGAEGTKTGGNNEKLIPVFDLGVQPLANDFRGDRDERAGYAPLRVLFCPRCTLAQLSVTVRPEILYSNYLYVTSPSQTMQRHFEVLTDVLREEQGFTSVLEIGSNDGVLLKYLREGGAKVAGIDPAENLAELARKDGIPTVASVFSRAAASHVLGVAPNGFDLIIARHVFCHVDDWREFIDCLAIPSHKDTLVAIEVPYVQDLLRRGEFDTIYHEHTSYLSIKAMGAMLADSPFQLHRVIRFPIHGGAIVLMLRRRDYDGSPDQSVADFLEKEDAGADAWKRFSAQASANIESLKNRVRNLRREGKRVAGMGASAKSTVCINACGFTRNDIEFITDTTPQKLWKLSPGGDIPIVDEGAILRELPDYMVCFAWNYIDEIMKKQAMYLKNGGQFIVPVSSDALPRRERNPGDGQ